MRDEEEEEAPAAAAAPAAVAGSSIGRANARPSAREGAPELQIEEIESGTEVKERKKDS